MDPQTQTSSLGSLDPQAVNLAKAIRQSESGGNFGAKGASGEFGAYQFMPDTWAKQAQKYGVTSSLDKATPEEQNKVAYSQIKEWKDAGYNPGQIASMWNAGVGEPDAYTGKFSDGSPSMGTNKQGVKFNVPQYAKSVAQAYQTLKSGGQVGMDPNNPSSIAGTQTTAPESSGQAPAGGYSVGGFAGNVFKSGAGVLGGIGNMILHPLDTLSNIGNLGLGVAERGIGVLTGNQPQNEQTAMADAMGKFFADRYGGWDKIKNSLYNDPVGVALDLSTILGGGGALLKAGGTAGKVGEFANITNKAERAAAIAEAAKAGELGTAAKLGQGMLKAGEVIDPLAAGTKAIGYAGGKIAGYGADVLGITSGAGGEAVRSMYDMGKVGGQMLKDTTEALRGRMAAEDVLKNAQDALQVLKDQRKAEYLKIFNDEVAAGGKTAQSIGKLPFESVKADLIKDLTENYGAKIKNGVLDLSQSSVAEEAAQKVIQKVYKDIVTWKDKSPQGLDTLKRRLDDYFKPTSNSRAIVTKTRNSVKDILVKNVPKYEKMVKGYEDASNGLEEAQFAMGKPRDNQEQALRRLRSVFRDTQKERLSTIGKVEAQTGKNIKGQVAGMIMNPLIPGGLAKYATGGLGLGAITHPAALPGLLPGLLFTSPRVIAETARALGITARKLDQVVTMLEKTGLTRQQIMQMLYQANRTTARKGALSSAQ